ncbi:alpha/beta hydrolase [Paracoccus lutimaris]|uniref:AB hydrolase-1 domain-containing protein n=1 Tax=Paracoccus lutimaris TaxID=1490030 RepID=A0A368YKL7_9RHOB|nr:alpha/beta fold hydrolase [Paracoccus lutimaris]RCW80782.1 hypothetical protein DFP89_11727 [Paracoccus lutimaris]
MSRTLLDPEEFEFQAMDYEQLLPSGRAVVDRLWQVLGGVARAVGLPDNRIDSGDAKDPIEPAEKQVRISAMTAQQPIWTDNAGRHAIATSFGPVPLVMAEPAGASNGTVLLVHGRNGAPGQPQIAEIAEAYLALGWRVVAPELPHSIALPDSGPSDRVTFSGHTQAAAEVWAWVCQQWPDERRALAGHSIGAFAIAHLAAASPEVHHVLAVSPPLSGRVLLSAREAMGPAAIEAVMHEAPLYYAEMPTADAAPALARTQAALAVVTGAADGLVRLDDARAYFNAAPNGRFFAALPDEHHCPAGAACGRMLSAALSALGA